ncbi:unnamed protein product [Ixodes persulcatus]
MSYPPGQQGYASGGHGYPAQGQVYSSGGMSYPLGSQGYPTPGRMGVAQGYTQPTAQGIYTSAVGTGVPAAGNPGYPSAPSPQYVTSQNQQGYTNWADLVNAAGRQVVYPVAQSRQQQQLQQQQRQRQQQQQQCYPSSGGGYAIPVSGMGSVGQGYPPGTGMAHYPGMAPMPSAYQRGNCQTPPGYYVARYPSQR